MADAKTCFSVRLSTEEAERLKVYAEANGVSMNTAIRALICKATDMEDGVKPNPEWTSGGLKQRSIRINDAMWNDTLALAKRRGQTHCSMIRTALIEFFENHPE